MIIHIAENYAEMSRQVCLSLLKEFLGDGRVNIGLPTGETPTGLYEKLVDFIKLGIPLNNCHFYNIDEYSDVDLMMVGTCNQYLQEHFYSKAVIPEKNIHRLTKLNFPSWDGELAKVGGLDTIILGIGLNGHIAYNEPGTSFESGTHELVLTNESRVQHSGDFGGFENVPLQAITMGIKTIMNAKRVILMASGDEKAAIIHQSLIGPITPHVPASVLQLHPNLSVYLDQGAGIKLGKERLLSTNTII